MPIRRTTLLIDSLTVSPSMTLVIWTRFAGVGVGEVAAAGVEVAPATEPTVTVTGWRELQLSDFFGEQAMTE